MILSVNCSSAIIKVISDDIRKRGAGMEIIINRSKLLLVQSDITRQKTDAIVNAANSSLMGGGGVDGAIHRAGGPQILEECQKIVLYQGRLPAGKAAITSGGNLPARYVIHTVGPVWYGGKSKEAELLSSAYSESLRVAEEYKLCSIAFPSISTGAYGSPVDEAAGVAIQTIVSFLQTKAVSIIKVIFVLFDCRTYEAYRKAMQRHSAGN
jgi:O-acetyl-ADP-ribose deacetylase